MSIFTVIEDRPTPQQVYNWRVWMLAIVTSCASLMIGYDSAFIGQTIELDSFRSEFHFDQWDEAEQNRVIANIICLYQAGAFFGALLAYPMGYFLGRRWGLWITAIVFTFGAGIMMGANGERGLAIMYFGRVLAGLGVGSGSNLTPIYISELSPPAIRGRLVGIYDLGWQLGGMVGFWINFGVSDTLPEGYKQWIIPFAVQLIPSGLLLIGCSFFIRESPRWLFSRGRREEAMQSLCWIRQLPESDVYIMEEVAAINGALEDQNAKIGMGFWKPFQAAGTNPAVMWRLFIGSSLFFWQNGTGVNAINYYNHTVFKSMGITGSLNQIMSGIFGVIKSTGTIAWLWFLIDHVGRRPLLIWGGVGGSVCLWIIGAYVKIKNPAENETSELDGAGIMAIFFFYLYTLFYSPSWNGTPWVLNSEMFDANIRSLAQALAAASLWLWTFIVSRFTPQMFATMGYGVYFFFASLMIASSIFVFFLIPETKSVPLEAMDSLFKTKPVWRAHGRIMQELQEANERPRVDLQELNECDDKPREEFVERV
ncbi:hypothetical protein FE257_008235 [Aspergillus nanangensis]|uniref:Quinate transporter n=1 Tax=Aspergillus nanangensis TaxID=2582783 RepID=A0AAD4GTQ1_ASPNN|nr:hypothetical protein FE257_008235 [Aspergillus nanangensis]